MAMKVDKIVVVDLECTCWDAAPPPGQMMEIIEVGICLYHTLTGEITDKRGYIVRPACSTISDYCAQLTGITQRRVEREGRPLGEIINQIRKRYPIKSRPWGSWGDFDRIHFEKECQQKGIAYPFGPTHLNIRVLFSLACKIEARLGMDAALQQKGLDLVGRHHCGADDAYNTACLLKSLFSDPPES